MPIISLDRAGRDLCRGFLCWTLLFLMLVAGAACAAMPNLAAVARIGEAQGPAPASARAKKSASSAIAPARGLLAAPSTAASVSEQVMAEDALLNDQRIIREYEDIIEELDFYVNLSQKLGIPLDGTENPRLLAAVEEWLGTRYRYGGCSKSGVDCSCLVQNIFRDAFGIELSRNSRTISENDMRPVDREALQEGDLVCFKIRSRNISHIGIYLKDGKFVHASRSYGVKIENLDDPYFSRRYAVGGRVLNPEGMGSRDQASR